jgi:hypothetical protein
MLGKMFGALMRWIERFRAVYKESSMRSLRCEDPL